MFTKQSVLVLAALLATARAQDVSQAYSNNIHLAHGITASVAWVIMFPLGAIAIRALKSNNAWWIHASIQGVTMAVITASAATGIVLANFEGEMSEYHPIIGLVLFGLIFFQAAGGIVHHLLFRKHRRSTIVSMSHIWLGRIIITLGMINGGLGLLLADNSTRGENIAYGVIAGVIWVIYIVFAVTGSRKKEADPLEKYDDK